MKLAISNIAWDRSDEAAAVELMRRLGVAQVEIAPTKVWDVPLEATDNDIEAYRAKWKAADISPVALQSLNFGHPEFAIFGDEAIRTEMLEYLRGIVVLGAKLGVKILVFGSPKNRLVAGMDSAKANDIASDFFYALGQTAQENNVCFCIEPNPRDYGCDFVTNTATGIDLVKTVNHPGFGLHLDAAGMTLAGDDIASSIAAAAPYLRHFHLSEPYLEEVGPGKVDHVAIAAALGEIGYDATVSIEMKALANGTDLERAERSIAYVQSVYPL